MESSINYISTFSPNFDPPSPYISNHQQFINTPLPHISSFNLLPPLSYTSFQCKIRGVFRFLLKFGLYLNVKVHNIPFGTLTPLFNTKDLIHTSNNSKKKKKWKHFTNFLLTSAIYEHPPPPDQQPSAFGNPLPLQKC